MEQYTDTSRSPVPQPPQRTLTFSQAIDAVSYQDATITKLEWGDESAYGRLRDGFLMLRRDGKWFRWTLNDGDLSGTDWIVLAE